MRYALETLKPVSATTRYQAERKRVRNKWTTSQAAIKCRVNRSVWYRAMAGDRVTVETRAAFARFVKP